MNEIVTAQLARLRLWTMHDRLREVVVRRLIRKNTLFVPSCVQSRGKARSVYPLVSSPFPIKSNLEFCFIYPCGDHDFAKSPFYSWHTSPTIALETVSGCTRL